MDASITEISGFGARKISSSIRKRNLLIFLRFNGHWEAVGDKELSETKFFPFAKKRGWVETFHFMQGGATLHPTEEVFEAIYNVYVIGLGYPRFAHGGIE